MPILVAGGFEEGPKQKKSFGFGDGRSWKCIVHPQISTSIPTWMTFIRSCSILVSPFVKREGRGENITEFPSSINFVDGYLSVICYHDMGGNVMWTGGI